MAHTAPPENPHRRLENVFGVLAVLVGVAIAVVAIVALHHPKGKAAADTTETGSSSPASTAPASTAKPKTSAPKSSATSTPTNAPTTSAGSSAAGTGRLPLVVLNNTSSVSSADAAARFQAAGWTVTDTSTFEGSILSTAAYYDPNVAGAQAAADQLQQQFPAIQRVKAKFDGLPAGPIVVVLTSDYS